MDAEGPQTAGMPAAVKTARSAGLGVGVKLGLVAGAAAVAVLAVTGYFSTSFYRDGVLAILNEAGSTESDAIRVVLEEQMMAGDRTYIARLITSITKEREGVSWIGLIDHAGEVRAASDPATVGRVYRTGDPECHACHVSAPAHRSRSVTLDRPAGGVLRTVTALANQPRCHACHDPAHKHNGVLIVDRSLAPLRAAVTGGRTQALLGGAATFVALLTCIGVAVDRLVVRRLRRLQNAARDLGDVEAHPATRGDEIAALADEFDRMSGALARQREVIRHRDEERSHLLGRVISSQEEERSRIARELHDGVGQTLSALLMQVRSAPEGGGGERLALGEKVADSIEEIRRLAGGLRPALLDDYGLKAAIERHIEEIAGLSPCAVDFQIVPADGLDARLDPAVEVVLYRVTQEALANVVRHAKARKASVILYRRPDSVTLLIEDDGAGFDPASITPAAGGRRLGIVGMRERVTLLGGDLVIESTPGAGATIRATLPLEA